MKSKMSPHNSGIAIIDKNFIFKMKKEVKRLKNNKESDKNAKNTLQSLIKNRQIKWSNRCQKMIDFIQNKGYNRITV